MPCTDEKKKKKKKETYHKIFFSSFFFFRLRKKKKEERKITPHSSIEIPFKKFLYSFIALFFLLNLKKIYSAFLYLSLYSFFCCKVFLMSFFPTFIDFLNLLSPLSLNSFHSLFLFSFIKRRR